jgi:hypothetical protein
MAVVTSFSPDSNFWELNPQLLLDPALKAYHKADRSKDKDSSSKGLWWVALCYDLDPDNKWRGGILAERQQLVGEEFLGSKDYYSKHRKELDPVIAAYVKFADTDAKAALRDWHEKMLERRQFLKETKYTLGQANDRGGWVGGTAAILDGMMANTKKLFDDYRSILKQLSEETGEGQGKGGSAASLSDDGSI